MRHRDTKRQNQVLLKIVELHATRYRFPTDREVGDELRLSENKVFTVVNALRLATKPVILGGKGDGRRLAEWFVRDAKEAALYWLLYEACRQRLAPSRDLGILEKEFLGLAARDRRLRLDSGQAGVDDLHARLETGRNNGWITRYETPHAPALKHTRQTVEFLEYLIGLVQMYDGRGRERAREIKFDAFFSREGDEIRPEA